MTFDNGTQFASEFVELLESFGVTPKPTTVKNLQANTFVERIHLVIVDSLRAMNLESRLYDDTSAHAILQAIAWSLRTTHHTQLQAALGQIVFDRDMIIHATYLAN